MFTLISMFWFGIPVFELNIAQCACVGEQFKMATGGQTQVEEEDATELQFPKG